MGDVEELTKFLGSKEGQISMRKTAENLLEKRKKLDETRKQMFSNCKYIEWLNQFTQDRKVFSDNDWLNSPKELHEYDEENVNKLQLFYEGIDDYARKNYIYPEQCSFGNFYRVKLDDNGYEIGILSGQGTNFFCRRVSLIDDYYFIDINDIICNKEQGNVKLINNNLNNLSNTIVDTYTSGVPLEAIREVINKVIEQIISSEKEKGNQKVLSKTR